MRNLFRSIIFVPGNNPRFIAKAKNLEADVVCLDLEDSVPAAQKDGARDMVASALEGGGFKSDVFVRTNSPASGLMVRDLEAAARAGAGGVVLPKVDAPGDLDGALRALKGNGAGDTRVMPSIESAAGVVNAFAIAAHGANVCALVFGIFDLLHDMGIEYTERVAAASYGRSKVPVDAAAAGIPAVDGIWQDVRDARGFEADCVLGRSLGYAGKSLIHPDQIRGAHRLFAPTAPEVDWAKRVCGAYEGTAGAGRGATTVDGKMVDEVHYRRARAVLDAAGRAG